MTAAPSDNDLHFTVVRDGVPNQVAMIQDSRSSVVEMNFTGQHRTFVKDISMASMENYEGLIVCASQDAYVKMSGGIAYGQDAITTNESLPVVALSKTMKDKRCFGVISSTEDPEQRKEAMVILCRCSKKKKAIHACISTRLVKVQCGLLAVFLVLVDFWSLGTTLLPRVYQAMGVCRMMTCCITIR